MGKEKRDDEKALVSATVHQVANLSKFGTVHSSPKIEKVQTINEAP